MRLWPKTLFGQLTLILVSGTLAIQLLSSSIWFDVRYAQVLEAPVRLMEYFCEVLKRRRSSSIGASSDGTDIHDGREAGARRLL